MVLLVDYRKGKCTMEMVNSVYLCFLTVHITIQYIINMNSQYYINILIEKKDVIISGFERPNMTEVISQELHSLRFTYLF